MPVTQKIYIWVGYKAHQYGILLHTDIFIAQKLYAWDSNEIFIFCSQHQCIFWNIYVNVCGHAFVCTSHTGRDVATFLVNVNISLGTCTYVYVYVCICTSASLSYRPPILLPTHQSTWRSFHLSTPRPATIYPSIRSFIYTFNHPYNTCINRHMNNTHIQKHIQT